MTEKTTQPTKPGKQSTSALAMALHTIGFDSDELHKAADVLADGEVLKAASSLSAATLTGGELVRDRWTEGRTHAVPTREEIRTGPSESMSGGGAERFIRDYSNPAPQDGLTMEAMRLEEHLVLSRGYMRSISDQVAAVAKHQEAYTTILTALAGSVAGGKSEFTATDELTNFAKQCSVKSQKFFDAARAALAKAVTIQEDINELSGDAKKLRKSEIKALRISAAELIIKAQYAALSACSGGSDTTVELRKSISTLVDGDPSFKAKTDAMRDKMREKDEKAGTKKALKKSRRKWVTKAVAKLAAKAAAKESKDTKEDEAAKSNQADEQDKDTKNQDDKSVSTKAELTAETEAMIRKALEGTAMFQGTVADLISVLNGRSVSKGATSALTLVKSATKSGDLLDQMGRVEKAIADGRLSSTEAMRARDLASKYTAVEAGAISKSMWSSLVLKSSHIVQELFPEATAA